MPVEIPLTSDGARTFNINTGLDVFYLRTYYIDGQDSAWLLDIADSAEQPLITGLKLVPGSENILKGQGDKMEGYQLFVYLASGEPGALEAPGNTLRLLLYNPGEENWFSVGDPLLNTEYNKSPLAGGR